MKRIMLIVVLMLVAFTVTPAAADFYVIAGGGRLGTAITALPYTITDPGLYYLTRNLTSTGSAITVHANNVTIDLSGFCLTGPGKGSGFGKIGIVVAAGHTNVEIRNGSIMAFGDNGIQSQSTCNGIRVVGVRVGDTGHDGITLPGSGNLIMDCTVMNAADNGIHVGKSSLVKGSQVLGSGISGIILSNGSTAVVNTVLGGLYGIFASDGTLVMDNIVSGSGNYGINVSSDCTITRNTAFNNTGTGISAGTYCTITNNTTDGLTNGTNCTLANNTVKP